MAGSPGSDSKKTPETLAPGKDCWWMGRAEVDTSAPFESVKEAVDHFGGSGHWKPRNKGQGHFDPEVHHFLEDNIATVEEQTGMLEKDLIVKERETLEVLKELEMTKKILDGLKLQVQKELSKAPSEKRLDNTKVHPVIYTEESSSGNLNPVDSSIGAKPSPCLILMELKQAKLNLTRTTSDLAGIRSSIELLSSELEREKISLGKTHEKIASNSAQISSLEKELGQTRLMLQLIKDLGYNGSKNPPDISRKLHELMSETEQFRRVAEASKSEALKMAGEIEQTKAGIKTAEIRLLAARKMEAAAKAAEAAALAEIKALMNCENPAKALKNSSRVTLSVEEYNMLVRKAQEADGLSRKRIDAATAQVDEANKSKMELSKKVDEAKAEIRSSRKALGEALNRVEVANKGKLAVEEALRKWRSDHGQKRRSSVHSSPRFKNSYPGQNRRDSKMMDMNGLSLITDGSKSILKPTLSIGQILSRKLMGPEELETGKVDSISERPKVSLGQMLSRRHGISSPDSNRDGAAPCKPFQAKKKKLGFVGSFSLILPSSHDNKRNKKKNRQAWSPK